MSFLYSELPWMDVWLIMRGEQEDFPINYLI